MRKHIKNSVRWFGVKSVVATLLLTLAVSLNADRLSFIAPAVASVAADDSSMPALGADVVSPSNAASIEAPATASPATSLKFTVSGQDCGGGGWYRFYIGNAVIGQVDAPNCVWWYYGQDPITIFETTDPAHLALAADACITVKVERHDYYQDWYGYEGYVSYNYVAYAKLDITRADGSTNKVCVVDYLNWSPSGGGTCEPRNFDAGYDSWSSYATTYVSSPPDTDGDGTLDCSDTDVDGDGVDNDVDNCPATPNADQADADNDGLGNICQPTVMTVPWFGSAAQPHQVYAGGTLVLQGTAQTPSGTPATIQSASWDPGDGSAAIPVNISNPKILEAEHQYSGADGTPYTAKLTVTMPNGSQVIKNFKVIVKAKTGDVEANMAIDKALWYLYKKFQFQSNGTGYWKDYGNHTVAATATGIQSFFVNGHRETGDVTQDPYVGVVRAGLRTIFSHLSRVNIGTQGGNNPDTNGNGIALYSGEDSSHTTYNLGQIVDAIVASGTPTATAAVGNADVQGRTYKAIVEDLMDMFYYGQADAGAGEYTGGWGYGVHNNDQWADNSISQWAAIAGLAAEDVWGLSPQTWVKDLNRDNWLVTQQYLNAGDPSNDGRFVYNGGGAYGWTGWTDAMSVTPSGMVQLIWTGVPSTDERYTRAVSYLTKHWSSMINEGGTSQVSAYSMFAITKALRLAKPSSITTITDGTTTFDWYANESNSPSDMGIRRRLLNAQYAEGKWVGVNGLDTNEGSLATAIGVIILSPSILQLGPSALCDANPSIVAKGKNVAFDGSGSIHQDPNGTITSYAWNFQDGVTATGVSTTHAFSSLGTFNVQLTVSDGTLSSSTTCPVTVIDGNTPPAVNIGGPYEVCSSVGTVILDGSTSTDDGTIVSFEWDWTGPLNFASPDATGATVDATAAFRALGEGTHDVGLRVTDNEGKSTSRFTTVKVYGAGTCPLDPDDDGDGVSNSTDNCSAQSNPDQSDADHDGQGDPCDADDDNDGTPDADDTFPTDPTETTDTDGDGTGNNADTDDDGDGTADVNDAFPSDPAETTDTDGDGTGNNADTDEDGDGVVDANDAFPTNPAETTDTDGDGTGNNADTDDDGDGVLDINDPYPGIPNRAPVCTDATPSVSMLWAPNHQFNPITLNGVTDADGDVLGIKVVSIFQDELVGSGGATSSGSTGPDGAGVGTSTALVRAERMGNPKQPGNGRVYTITWTATDIAGATCTATTRVGVPHDQSGARSVPVNDGALYDSTIALPKK
jgi:hypothetical protein